VVEDIEKKPCEENRPRPTNPEFPWQFDQGCTLIHDAPLLLLLLELVLLIRLVTLLLLLMVLKMGQMLLLLLMMLMVRHALLLLLVGVVQVLMLSLLRPHLVLPLITEKLSLDFFESPGSSGLDGRRRLLALRRHLVSHGLLSKKLLLLLEKQEVLRRQLAHRHDRRIVEPGRKLRHGELHRVDAGR